MGSIWEAEDVANAAAFLASDGCRLYYRTGTSCRRRNGNVKKAPRSQEIYEEKSSSNRTWSSDSDRKYVEEFWNGIKEGKVGIGEITHFDTTEYKVKLAAEVKDFNGKRPNGFPKQQEYGTLFPVCGGSSKRSFGMMGLDMEKEDPFRVGVIDHGSGIGSLQVVDRI